MAYITKAERVPFRDPIFTSIHNPQTCSHKEVYNYIQPD